MHALLVVHKISELRQAKLSSKGWIVNKCIQKSQTLRKYNM